LDKKIPVTLCSCRSELALICSSAYALYDEPPFCVW